MNGSKEIQRSARLVFSAACCILLLSAFFLPGCLEIETPAGTQAPGSPAETYVVYFTDPSSPEADSYRGGPDAQLARAIQAARVSVDAAIYDLNLWSIRDAFLDAHQRGLTVRLVVESDNQDEPEIQALKDAGIPVLGDRREGLMHNKFVVLDRFEVWTGSMNFTITDGYRNNNNLVQLLSSSLAQDYTVEFEEMFLSDRFGPDEGMPTPLPDLEIGDSRLEVFFSPDDGTENRLVELVKAAQHSVDFLAFSFTSDALARALLERAGSGVEVRGVFEEAQVNSNTGSQFERLLRQDIDVRLDGNPRNMHHKVLIVDAQVVVFGSYNFSKSAETRNDENTIILHDKPAAQHFLSEFERIYEDSHR